MKNIVAIAVVFTFILNIVLAGLFYSLVAKDLVSPIIFVISLFIAIGSFLFINEILNKVER